MRLRWIVVVAIYVVPVDGLVASDLEDYKSYFVTDTTVAGGYYWGSSTTQHLEGDAPGGDTLRAEIQLKFSIGAPFVKANSPGEWKIEGTLKWMEDDDLDPDDLIASVAFTVKYNIPGLAEDQIITDWYNMVPPTFSTTENAQGEAGDAEFQVYAKAGDGYKETW